MSKLKIFDQETNSVTEWLIIAICGAVSFVVVFFVSQIATYTIRGVKRLIELKKEQQTIHSPIGQVAAPTANLDDQTDLPTSSEVSPVVVSTFRKLVSQSVITANAYSIVIRQYEKSFEALAFEDGQSYDLGSIETDDMHSARRSFETMYLLLQTPLASASVEPESTPAVSDGTFEELRDEFIPVFDEYEQIIPNQA